jgi:arsenate reductase-like glutaredoxin family protein
VEELSDTEIAKLISQEWTLLRRPLFVIGGKHLVVGGNATAIESILRLCK